MRLERIVNRIRSVPKVWSGARFTFSQYAEDMLLFHMVPLSRGFYVDVGAYHPRTKSNTYKLYLRGWSGITIEPNADVQAVFRRLRPRDTHLPVGISSAPSQKMYHKFANANVNSFDSEWQQEKGTAVINRLPVQCYQLSDVLDEHCPGNRIDLLSVDCEGSDMDVIESLDWSRYRPSVVIVEDFEHFKSGAHPSGSSAIRSFMTDREYAFASAALFSTFYVDRHALRRSGGDSGFRLAESQLSRLAL